MLLTINVIAVCATLFGGLFPLAQNLLSRTGLWRIFALRSGILLAVTFTEILPAAISNKAVSAGWGALAAFVLFFYAESLSMVDTCPEYMEECGRHFLGWMALAALGAHSFIDGFNLSVSFSAGDVAGSAVGSALILHKLADGFTMTSLLRQSGYTSAQTLAGLLGVSMATPLGSLASHAGLTGLNPGVASILLGFAAGSFLYIAAADVLPRLHKSGDRASLGFFGVGLAGMTAIHLFR
ncbi:MAG: ZIP family metal transporter [Elusimicrobia bacterium]|nr:ZIP family metal transporter [Elusimicrobiota bacterium]